LFLTAQSGEISLPVSKRSLITGRYSSGTSTHPDSTGSVQVRAAARPHLGGRGAGGGEDGEDGGELHLEDCL
jgi:hypothetical protein